jgi:hypothetical protein
VSGDDGAAVSAIADDVRDLTTAHAETANEANFDENISRLEGQDSIEVTADSGEVSGLDTGKTNPFFDASERAGESVESTVDIPDVARGMAAGCWPDGVTHDTVGVGGFRGAIAQTGGPHGEVRRSTHPTALVAATVVGNRSVGLDGSVGCAGAAGVIGDGSPGVGAIADDVHDLTTANEAKVDEIVSRVQGNAAIDVTAVIDEVSGLDSGKTNPFFDGSERGGESVESTVDIPDVAREMAAGCWPDGVTHKMVGVEGFPGAIAQTGGPHGEVRGSTHPTALVAATVAGNRSERLDGSAETGGPHPPMADSTHPTALVAGTVAGNRSDRLDGSAETGGPHPPMADSTHPTALVAGAGEREDSATGMANLEGAMPGGCCPPRVTHPP